MSLDVYLTMEDAPFIPQAAPRIFIREDGQNKEISRVEWDARFPGREPVTVMPRTDSTTVYSANITHNLNTMAGKAGLYGILWRPEECFLARAHQLSQPLRIGLYVLYHDRKYFEQFAPKNGWGTYTSLCRFVLAYAAACEQYPQAHVSVTR
jgi:hypothetical protein